jgi:O-antigen ligase
MSTLAGQYSSGTVGSEAKASWASTSFIWATTVLLSCLISGMWNCLYLNGQLPFKPRDATLGLSALSLFLVLFNRPAINPAALLLLLFPVLRVFDAAFLKRYMAGSVDEHATMTMTMVSMLILMLVITSVASTEHWRVILLRVAVTTICIGVASILYEFSGGAKYTSIPGRPSGFLGQPNDAIIILCLMLGMVFCLNEWFWGNVIMIGLTAVGVALTLSRSGMLVFGALVMVFVAMNLRRHFTKIALVAALAIPAAGAGIVALSSASSGDQSTAKNNKDRLEAIFGGSTDKMESGERMKDLSDGWEAATEKPLLGWGTAASSTKWMPHNLWVAMWIDMGVFGALLLLLLLGGLTALVFMAKGQGIYALLPLWLFTVFSQNLCDMPGYWLPAFMICNLLVTTRIRLVLRL